MGWKPAAMVMALASVGFTACGEPSTTSSPATSSPSTALAQRLSATTPPPTGDPGDADGIAPSTGDIPEAVACPERLGGAGPQNQDMAMAESARLEPMLATVLSYGSERPDVFGGYGLHWVDADDASVFVSFTEDVDQHRAALVELVEFPDELIVCQVPNTEVGRRAIQSELADELGGRFTSIGGGVSGVIEVALNPNEEALAAELVERWGNLIDVSVGALDYPIEDAAPVCGDRLEPGLIDGLAVELAGPTAADSVATISDIGDARVTIELVNNGDEPVRFNSGTPRSTITDATGKPRAVDLGYYTGEGIQIELEPGERQGFTIDVSLAACDPADGYMLSPGEVFVVVSFYNAELQGDMHSPPIPITLTDS